jgi:hypothetical protein
VAEISGMSLDWQDLPGDYLNLVTQETYTVPQARNLINKHLFARGFTMLRDGEMLTVAEISKIDPSAVPRVEPEELAKRDDYEWVKVSFSLDSLMAATAKTDFETYKSKNGKLTAMTETNRLDAMDAVANLREIYALLKQEQSTNSKDRLVRKFTLIHARATEVQTALETLLGLEKKPAAGGGGPQDPKAAQQAAMMRAMQQGGGGPGGPGGPGGQPGQPGQPGGQAADKSKTAVTLFANQRENSILAHAPADKMAIIEQTIAALDVPNERGQGLMANMRPMQIYRLTGVDPEPVVKTLNEIGNLDPTTRLEVDKKNKSIIATASLVDHVMIRAIVDKLSGSERKFDVKPLRRLPADFVANTIMFMMGVEPKKKEQRQSPFSYFGGMPSNQNANERPNEFRVDADVEHNRLLLWANEVEMGEVENLLVKLGEIPPKGGSGDTMRVIDSGDPQETKELIERIRQMWPGIAPNNPLSLPAALPGKKETEKTPKQPAARPEDRLLPPKTAGVPTATLLRLTQWRHESAEDVAANAADESPQQAAPAAKPNGSEKAAPAQENAGKPPVSLSIGPDGRLIISSQDAEALDQLEQLVMQLAPPRKDYRVFHLTYAGAVGVAMNLEDFFKEEKKDKGNSFWDMYWGGGGSNQNENEGDMRLSKRKKLKFIADSESSTILVEGGDPSQLKTVADLIALYDQPPPKDSESVRKTATIHLRYAKASAVAETIKEVYRDLLSENDKSLANQQQGNRRNVVQYSFDYGGGDSDKNSDRKMPKFKGQLSVGVDDASNSMVVSAPKFLFEHVTTMINELDQAAADHNAVRVVKMKLGTSPELLQEMLDALMGSGSAHVRTTAAKEPPSPKSASKPAAKSGGNSSGKKSSDSSTPSAGK